jgi:hypothetical protein
MTSILSSKLCSTISRLSLLPAISLICIISTAPAFAEDLSANACQPSNSLSVLVRGKNVVAYVPKGAWMWPVNDIAVVNVEGRSITPQSITTPNPVNACASNSETGQTVCTANNTDVYLISGTKLQSTLTSSGSGMAMYFEGNCTNCGVTMDPIRNRAVIGVNLSAAPPVAGFQILNLGRSPKWEDPFPSQAPNVDGTGQQISGGILIDPLRNLILSPNEHSNYEIVKLANPDDDKKGDDEKGNDKGDDRDKDKDKNKDEKARKAGPGYFEKTFPLFPAFGSAGEDCKTGIIMAGMIQEDPSRVFIADLSRAEVTSGSPGTWKAPSQIQTLSESHLSHGANGLAVAQGTHTGVVTGEFGFDAFGGNITAIVLPKNKGQAKDGDDDNDDDDRGKGKNNGKADNPPEIRDWVTCSLPGGFITGFAPHTVTAYQSPTDGHAMALVANWPGDPARSVAVIDLTRMLDKDIVPRTRGTGLGHACASGFLPTTGRDPVVRFISVP